MHLRRPELHWRRLVVIIGIVAALAAGERFVRAAVARWWLPTAGAQWIWAPGLETKDGPVAFYAIRDFTLHERPAKARLLALADEEYVLYLNGSRVGSGAYRPGARLDRYEVAGLLRRGRNRLLAELRSGRALGGFLASLDVPGPRGMHLGTDGSWSILWRHHPGLLTGNFRPHAAASARVWADPPTGRWGAPSAGVERPLYRGAIEPGPALPGRLVAEWRGASWHPVGGDAATTARGWLLFDWGRTVSGYLAITLHRRAAPRGLVFFADRRPDPRRRTADAWLDPVPGRGFWSASRVHRFRYVLVATENPLERVVVIPTRPTAGAELWRLQRAERPLRGVFGLAPPLARSPVETAIRQRLESLPGPS